MDIEVDGLHIQYIDQGPADPRATVLLLHGWGVDGSLYHLITDHLSGRFRVVIPDLPGFGGSRNRRFPGHPTATPILWNTSLKSWACGT